jgi:hypothetical protein
MQEQEEEGEQILSLRGKTVNTTVRDISHLGIVLEQNTTLETEGEFEGSGYSTVTIHMKPDGSSQYEQKGFVTTPKGELVTIRGRGTGKQVSPTNAIWKGEVAFLSQAANLSSLTITHTASRGAETRSRAVSARPYSGLSRRATIPLPPFLSPVDGPI